MKKQLIRNSSTKDLFMVYDDKHCFYVVSIGNIKINKKGDVTSKTSRNVLFSSECLQDCLNYFENGGIK